MAEMLRNIYSPIRQSMIENFLTNNDGSDRAVILEDILNNFDGTFKQQGSFN